MSLEVQWVLITGGGSGMGGLPPSAWPMRQVDVNEAGLDETTDGENASNSRRRGSDIRAAGDLDRPLVWPIRRGASGFGSGARKGVAAPGRLPPRPCSLVCPVAWRDRAGQSRARALVWPVRPRILERHVPDEASHFLGNARPAGSEGFEAFREGIDLASYAATGYPGLFLFVAIGIAATVIMQSSHATLVLVIKALAAHQVTYENALAVAIGSNVGTTITAVLGSFRGWHGAVSA